MSPNSFVSGRCAVLDCNDVDTDQIVPAEYCKRLTKTGYEDVLFARWRRHADFFLNRTETTGTEILVARRNFGTGSSREHAVWALRDGGFRAIIAASFGDIFRRNAFRNGLLAVEISDYFLNQLHNALQVDPDLVVEVNAELATIAFGAESSTFPIEAQAQHLLVNGLDEIDATLRHDLAIEAYERVRHHTLPRFGRAAVGIGR